MIRFTLRALIHQWRIWIGAVLVLGFASSLVNVCLAHRGSVHRPEVVAAGRAAGVSPDQLEMSGTSVYVYSAMVTIPVVAVVGNSCVEALRTSWARWRLAGSSPRQVFLTVMTTVGVVGLIASAPGIALGFFIDQPISSLLTAMASRRMGTIQIVQSPTTVLLTVLSIVVIALVGAIGPARAAVRTPATETLRASTPARLSMGIARWSVSLLWMLIVGFQLTLAFTVQPSATAGRIPAGSGQAMLAGLLIGVMNVLVAPVLIPKMLSIWTKPANALGPAWLLARRSAGWRSGIVASSIGLLGLSFSFTASLMTGLYTNQAAAASAGIRGEINQVDTLVMTAVLGTMALLGSVAVIGMTARSREREFALLRCAGTTARQVGIQSVIEAFYYVGTALVTALVPLAVATVGEASFFAKAAVEVEMSPALGPLALVAIASFSALATVLLIPVRNAFAAPVGPVLSPE